MSIGTKVVLGSIVCFIVINVLFQLLFVDTTSWRVRQMKQLLNTVEPQSKGKPVWTSLSPYSKKVHEWWNDGLWVKELSRNVSEDLAQGRKALDVFRWPIQWIEQMGEQLNWFSDALTNGTDRVYREIGHRL